MSSIPSARCSRCGKEISPSARGLCASCLLRTALSLEEGTAGYRILTVIGGDADAITYLAEPASGTERFVALKIIGPRRDVDELLSRYARWQPAFERAAHPAIRRIISMGRADESHAYIASEYVAGQTLSALSARAPLSSAERDAIVPQLRSALQAAHAAGIVHLNLAASRVRIRAVGHLEVKILGFETRTVVEGATGRPEDDLAALDALSRDLQALTLPR